MGKIKIIRRLISIQALRHIVYIVPIVFKIKNWYSFLLNYIGFRNEPKTYKFRNGIEIKTNEGIDATTIAVVFIKKDYGKINDNSIIIDIGSNIGAFSIYATTQNIKNTKVYSYEPMQKSYELFLQNITANNLENSIIPFNYGIASHIEKRKLFLANASPAHSIYSDKDEKYVEIDCITLKDIFDQNKINNCDILKMDCEGAEFEILYNETSKEYFAKIKEIRLEYHNQKKEGYNIKCLIKFLENNGFKLNKFKKHRGNQNRRNIGDAWFRRI